MNIFKKLFGKKEEEIVVNYHVLNGSIVINFEGTTYTLHQGDARYNNILLAIKEKDLQRIPELVDMNVVLKKKGIVLKDGELYFNKEVMPEALVKKLLELQSEGLPLDSLLKFWENLKQNPSENSKRMLYAFLQHNGHPLTNDGCFIAYRGVSEDFKDKRTGTFDNSPGSVCKMPREEVDEDPNRTCSTGLHVACFDYAKDFGERLIEVKVNPRDVVAVPVDYNGTKLRCCQFEVIREGKVILTQPLYDGDDSVHSEFVVPEDGTYEVSIFDHLEQDSTEELKLERYLVRAKGDVTWQPYMASSYEEAANSYRDDFDYQGELNVRKGNSYENFPALND